MRSIDPLVFLIEIPPPKSWGFAAEGNVAGVTKMLCSKGVGWKGDEGGRGREMEETRRKIWGKKDMQIHSFDA